MQSQIKRSYARIGFHSSCSGLFDKSVKRLVLLFDALGAAMAIVNPGACLLARSTKRSEVSRGYNGGELETPSRTNRLRNDLGLGSGLLDGS